MASHRLPITPRAKDVDWQRLALVYQRTCKQRGVRVCVAGQALGIHATSISNWLNGKNALSAVNMLVICDWAGLSPLAFLEDVADLPQGQEQPAAEPALMEAAHA